MKFFLFYKYFFNIDHEAKMKFLLFYKYFNIDHEAKMKFLLLYKLITIYYTDIEGGVANRVKCSYCLYLCYVYYVLYFLQRYNAC